MALNRTWVNGLVDDDGSNTVGELWDKADVIHIYDDVDAALVTQTNASKTVTALTASGTYNPLITTASTGTRIVEVSGATTATIGLVQPIHNTGEFLLIKNLGTGLVTLLNGSGSYGLFNLVTSAPTVLAPGGSASYYGANSVWYLVAHEQGGWVLPGYLGSRYTAPPGSWTVEASDETTYAYWLKGSTLFLNVYLSASSITGTPPGLYVALPSTFAVAKASVYPIVLAPNGANEMGIASTTVGANPVLLQRVAGTFSGTTNTTYAYFLIAIPVT